MGLSFTDGKNQKNKNITLILTINQQNVMKI